MLDPACGAGALLVAALERLVRLGVPADSALTRLHGVDVDPVAVALSRARLAAAAVRLGASPLGGAAELAAGLERSVVVGDALLPDASRSVGGFGAVLANPPWERLKVAVREHEGTPAQLADARAAVRARVTAIRDGGGHPLTGSGDLNAHLPFVETCWRLLAPGGRAALLVPASTVTDRQAGPLLAELLGAGDLESVHTLRVRFDGVTTALSSAVITLARNGSAPSAQMISDVGDVRRPELDADRAWALTPALVRTVNPSTRTAVLFQTPRDADLVARAHERFGVLLRRDPDGAVVADPWGARARTPVHLSREAGHVRTSPGPGLVPLGEAKLTGLLDPRAATWDDERTRPPSPAERADPAWTPRTRWWVPESLVRARYGDLLARGWLAGYRVVSTPRTARTLLPVALPAGAYANSLALLDAPRLPLLLAALASLPLDYVMRCKAGGNNLSLYKVEQLPVPPPAAYDVAWPGLDGGTLGEWLLRRLAGAVRWCDGLAPLAAELGRPGRDGAREADRWDALADLDAAHAHLLGWSRADLERVLGTFGMLRATEEARHGRYVTRDRVLAAHERLTPP